LSLTSTDRLKEASRRIVASRSPCGFASYKAPFILPFAHRPKTPASVPDIVALPILSPVPPVSRITGVRFLYLAFTRLESSAITPHYQSAISTDILSGCNFSALLAPPPGRIQGDDGHGFFAGFSLDTAQGCALHGLQGPVAQCGKPVEIGPRRLAFVIGQCVSAHDFLEHRVSGVMSFTRFTSVCSMSQDPERPCENAPRRPYFLIGFRAGYLTAP
jgi:hypothetical protein